MYHRNMKLKFLSFPTTYYWDRNEQEKIGNVGKDM
jgi:hypothetical protein